MFDVYGLLPYSVHVNMGVSPTQSEMFSGEFNMFYAHIVLLSVYKGIRIANICFSFTLLWNLLGKACLQLDHSK